MVLVIPRAASSASCELRRRAIRATLAFLHRRTLLHRLAFLHRRTFLHRRALFCTALTSVTLSSSAALSSRAVLSSCAVIIALHLTLDSAVTVAVTVALVVAQRQWQWIWIKVEGYSAVGDCVWARPLPCTETHCEILLCNMSGVSLVSVFEKNGRIVVPVYMRLRFASVVSSLRNDAAFVQSYITNTETRCRKDFQLPNRPAPRPPIAVEKVDEASERSSSKRRRVTEGTVVGPAPAPDAAADVAPAAMALPPPPPPKAHDEGPFISANTGNLLLIRRLLVADFYDCAATREGLCALRQG